MTDKYDEVMLENRQLSGAAKYLDLIMNRSDELTQTDLSTMETNNIILGDGAFAVVVFTVDNSSLSDHPGITAGSRRYSTAVMLSVLDGLATDRYMHYLAAVGGRVVLLLCFPQEARDSVRLPGICSSIPESCAEFCGILEKDHGVKCTYAISSIVFGRRNIKTAYHQCVGVIEYFMFRGKAVPPEIFTEDWNRELDPADENNVFHVAEALGCETARQLMTEPSHCKEVLKNAADQLFSQRPFAIECLNSRTVMFCTGLLSKLVTEDYIDGSWLEQFQLIPLLLGSGGEKEFRDTLREQISLLIQYAEKRRAFSASRRIDDMKNYVQNNFFDPNLSVSSVAERFEISQPLASSQFKKYAGVSLSDFIHQQRLQMAKELMTDSKMTMQEISQAVGYSSLVTMYRAFHRYEGVAPGQIRDSVKGREN